MPPRKGGGRKAFLKGVHSAHDPPPESGAQPPKEPAASSSSADVPSEQKSEPIPSPVKAAKAAVKPEVPRDEDAGEDSSHKDETRGQMVQRHKRVGRNINAFYTNFVTHLQVLPKSEHQFSLKIYRRPRSTKRRPRSLGKR